MRSVAVVLALLVSLAGCSAGKASSAPSSAAATNASAPGAGTGSVAGTIVDDAKLPIEGVEVALLDVPGAPDLKARSDASGKFSFGSLPVGEFRLAAQKLGYQSVARKVLVKEGEATPVGLVMNAIAVAVSYHATSIISGNMGCIVTVIVPAMDPGYTSYACGDTAAGNNLNANNKIYLAWSIGAGATMHVAEMFWKPQSSMSDQLRFQIGTHFSCSGPVCTIDAGYATKGGPPPVAHRLDKAAIKVYGNSPSHVEGRFTGGPVTPTSPVRVIIDQKFDVYLSDWFGEDAPENWTATPPKA
jgi:hypothetical protein